MNNTNKLLNLNYQAMNDCLRTMDLPWDITITRTDRGYSDFFRLYLKYVELLNE